MRMRLLKCQGDVQNFDIQYTYTNIKYGGWCIELRCLRAQKRSFLIYRNTRYLIAILMNLGQLFNIYINTKSFDSEINNSLHVLRVSRFCANIKTKKSYSQNFVFK